MRGRMLGLVPFLVLVGITAIWGSTFAFTKWQLSYLDPTSFLAVRFTITAVIMLALFWRRFRGLSRRLLGGAVLTGTLYGSAQLLQTWGLNYTSPSISGFVTGIAVIITPFLVWFIYRQPPRAIVSAAATMAFAGLGIITLNGQFGGGTVWGPILCLMAAFLYGGHIVAIGHFAPQLDPWVFTTVQMVMAALIGLAAGIPRGIKFPPTPTLWLAMGYMVIFASIIAVVGQSWAQRHIDAGRSAIIMSMEPVFAASFAIMAGLDHLTWNVAVGGALIVTATIMVEGTKLFRPVRLRRIFRYRGRHIPE